MKKILITLLAILGLVAITLPTSAESKGKEITIKGKACCAKCCLKEAESCQNVLQVEKDGKKTSYYLVQNDVAKEFHKNICKEVKPITVTGTCKKVDGKLEVTASKIELAK
ncbi:MAG: hypothetical protein HY301_00225 [Verrucomicrobia bacterium]|nr:hypothetical protein [Verrucomicrobiota bacterium]